MIKSSPLMLSYTYICVGCYGQQWPELISSPLSFRWTSCFHRPPSTCGVTQTYVALTFCFLTEPSPFFLPPASCLLPLQPECPMPRKSICRPLCHQNFGIWAYQMPRKQDRPWWPWFGFLRQKIYKVQTKVSSAFMKGHCLMKHVQNTATFKLKVSTRIWQ